MKMKLKLEISLWFFKNPFSGCNEGPERSQSQTLKDLRLEDRRKPESPESYITNSELFKLRSRGYKLVKKLSQGMSAKIYLCTKRKNMEEVKMACKVINKRDGEESFVGKFLPREISILAELSNPHCIQVYSVLETVDKCFVFMRLAEKGDLLDYLAEEGERGRLRDGAWESTRRMWTRQLLLALGYLHSKGIAHRDIKCENVLITANLNAKLADFGFSRRWSDGMERLSETYCGSVCYAAPEVLMGQAYDVSRCDVWSLGVVVFVAFNLKKPFGKEQDPEALVSLQKRRGYTWVEPWAPEGPKDLVDLMLTPSPKDRPLPSHLLNHPWMTQDKTLLRLLPDQ